MGQFSKTTLIALLHKSSCHPNSRGRCSFALQLLCNCVSLAPWFFCYPSTNSHHKSRSAGLEINSFWSHATWNKLCFGGRLDAFVKRPTSTFLPFMDEKWRTTWVSRHLQKRKEWIWSKVYFDVCFYRQSFCFYWRRKRHTAQRNIPFFPQTGSVLSLLKDSIPHWGTIFRRRISSPLANNVEHDHFENWVTAGSSIFLYMLDSFLY